MKTEHKNLVNARFLGLVLKELSKDFTAEEMQQLDHDAMMQWINKGATLLELKLKATEQLRLSGKIARVRDKDLKPPLL